MKLLSQNKLIKTSPVDHADWNYRVVLGSVQRLRFSLALSLLPSKSNRLLEIGFGSGVFMPSLCDRAAELYGVDVHRHVGAVKRALASDGIQAELAQASAEALPFRDRWFDSVVAVSSLEFVRDLNAACAQIRRVLKTKGTLVVVTPAESRLLDAGLMLLTGQSAKRDFGERRQAIIPALLRDFTVDSHRTAPAVGASPVFLYHALRLF